MANLSCAASNALVTLSRLEGGRVTWARKWGSRPGAKRQFWALMILEGGGIPVAEALGMQRLLTRHFGIVKVFGIGLAVFFAGSAVTQYTANKLLLDVEALAASADDDEDASDEDAEDAKAQAAAKRNAQVLAGMASTQTRKKSTAEVIVGGNVFCPTCTPVEEVPVEPGGGIVMASTQETRSQLPLELIATMESDDPAWSMATIRDLDSNALGPFATNEQVRPGVTILAVERGRVVLLNQGRREFITTDEAPPPPKPAAAPKKAPAKKPAPKSKKGKSVAIDGADQAINCSSENACTVDRAFVDKLISNPTQLMTQARMYPVTKDGENAGFRVSRIRSGSLATMIGLKNNDVITEINGAKLGTIDQALAMYQKLRRASHLSVTVSRGGAIITKEISIK